MIWLIGNKGMLGQDIEGLLSENNLNVIGTDREVDFTDLDVIKSFVSGKDIKWIINCAAYTAVDKAEDEIELAEKLNSKGPENLASITKEIGAKIIHISTDYVFEGSDSVARKEDDETGPISVYGKTKLNGENAISQILDEYFIIRTAWLYGPYGNNFVYTMLKLMSGRDELTVVEDQHGSPTYTLDLANLILSIINNNSNQYGIYHFSNEGETTWFGFAKEIYKTGREMGMLQSECNVLPTTSDKFVTKAKRPAYSLLSKEKVKNTLNFKVNNWQDSLTAFFDRISNNDNFTKMWKE